MSHIIFLWMENSESDTLNHILIFKTGHTAFFLTLLHVQLIIFCDILLIYLSKITTENTC